MRCGLTVFRQTSIKKRTHPLQLEASLDIDSAEKRDNDDGRKVSVTFHSSMAEGVRSLTERHMQV